MTVRSDRLTREFDQDMLGVYKAAKGECGYNAVRFLEMLHDVGGVQTAKRLLSGASAQYGFDKLWECGRLDLTVECLALRRKYQPLFDETELGEARRRLRAHDFDPDNCER